MWVEPILQAVKEGKEGTRCREADWGTLDTILSYEDNKTIAICIADEEYKQQSKHSRSWKAQEMW